MFVSEGDLEESSDLPASTPECWDYRHALPITHDLCAAGDGTQSLEHSRLALLSYIFSFRFYFSGFWRQALGIYIPGFQVAKILFSRPLAS